MKNKYNYFVSEIGNQIIKSVNNNLSFRNKFKDMAVEVKSLDARQTFARIISDTNCKYVMEIYIDPKDSEEYIKFIMLMNWLIYYFVNLNLQIIVAKILIKLT